MARMMARKEARPALDPALGLSADRLREMYRVMLLARMVDERCWLLNRFRSIYPCILPHIFINFWNVFPDVLQASLE